MRHDTYKLLMKNESLYREMLAFEGNPFQFRKAYDHTTPTEVLRELSFQRSLRKRVTAKFPSFPLLFLSDKNLQQASSERVASFNAASFPEDASVADLCCGGGGDLLALTGRGRRIFAVDSDPETLANARWNVHLYGSPAEAVEFSEGKALDWSLAVDGIFVDPDRRPTDRKTFSLDGMSPPLQNILPLIEFTGRLVVKLSPGSSLVDILGHRPDRLCFVEEGRTLKEILFVRERGTAAVDTATATGESSRRLACVDLDTGETYSGPPPEDGSSPLTLAPVPKTGGFIHDIGPSLMKSRLHVKFGRDLGLHPVNDNLGYWTSDAPVSSSLVKSYRCIGEIPFQKKWLEGFLNDLAPRSLALKSRGVKEIEETWAGRLKWRKGEGKPVALVLFRREGKITALFAEPSVV